MRDVSIASDLNLSLEYRHLDLKQYAVQESFKLAIKLRKFGEQYCLFSAKVVEISFSPWQSSTPRIRHSATHLARKFCACNYQMYSTALQVTLKIEDLLCTLDNLTKKLGSFNNCNFPLSKRPPHPEKRRAPPSSFVTMYAPPVTNNSSDNLA